MMGNVFLGVRYPPKPASLSLLKSNISNGKGDGGLFEHGTKDCHVRRKEARCDHRMQRFRCGELELLHAIRARPHRREKATPVLLRINNVTQERATSSNQQSGEPNRLSNVEYPRGYSASCLRLLPSFPEHVRITKCLLISPPNVHSSCSLAMRILSRNCRHNKALTRSRASSSRRRSRVEVSL